MALKGSREVRARTRAIRQVFKHVGRDWADAAVPIAKRKIATSGAVATGKTLNSIRRRNASQKKATVVGHYPVNFIDAGVRAHDIRPRKASVLKFDVGGRTVFARKVHKRATPARPFKDETKREALSKMPFAKRVIDLWNRAA